MPVKQPGRPKGRIKIQINMMIDPDLKEMLSYITKNYVGHRNRSKIINTAIREHLASNEIYREILERFGRNNE